MLKSPSDWTSVEITSTNQDGSLAMGVCDVTSQGDRFFTWTPTTGFELISLPINPSRAEEALIASDGSIAVLRGHNSDFQDLFFIWRPEQAAIPAEDFFVENQLGNQALELLPELISLSPSATGQVLIGTGFSAAEQDFSPLSFVVHLDGVAPQVDLKFDGEQQQIRWQNLLGWELFQSTSLQSDTFEPVPSMLIEGINVIEPQGERGFFQLRRLPSQ